MIQEYKEVVDTCKICRPWTRPGHRATSNTRVCNAFNGQIEVDLLFWDKRILLHIIDCCIRWTACKIIPDKQTSTILDAIDEYWIAYHQSPVAIVSDHEGALDSDSARLWADRRGTQIKLKPPGSIGASTVERHHEILRTHLHKIKGGR